MVLNMKMFIKKCQICTPQNVIESMKQKHVKWTVISSRSFTSLQLFHVGNKHCLRIWRYVLKKKHTAKRFYTTPKLLKSLNLEDKYRSPFIIISAVKKLVRSYFETKAVQLPNKKDISRKTLEKNCLMFLHCVQTPRRRILTSTSRVHLSSCQDPDMSN